MSAVEKSSTKKGILGQQKLGWEVFRGMGHNYEERPGALGRAPG